MQVRHSGRIIQRLRDRVRLPPGTGLGLAALLLFSCNDPPPPSVNATEVLMSFDRPAGFYGAPFPSADLQRSDGSIDLTAFPNPDHITLIKQSLALLADTKQGFATSGAVYFQLSGPIDPAHIPTLAATVTDDSPVYLMNVDAASPELGRRTPVRVIFEADGGPFGAPNLLSLLPLQGQPLRANTTYAAVVLRTLRDAAGHTLAQSPSMAALAAGAPVPSLSGAALALYRKGLAKVVSALKGELMGQSDVAALAVFTTGDPMSVLTSVRDDLLRLPSPAPHAPPSLSLRADMSPEVYPDYCVYQTTIDFPDYQSGDPPYTMLGGTFAFDPSGKPLVQRMETANLVLTVPRRKMPAAGFPACVLVRTGAGGDRPLVDRGVQVVHNGPSPAGSGPAVEFARAGFVGVQVDGPLGGLRNPTVPKQDEEYLIFNIFNPGALRDNVRESAVELTVLPQILAALSFRAEDCPGFVVDAASGGPPGQVKIDGEHLAIMGHSMGATIAPLTVALQPKYRALILSGAGGSWIENVIWKQKPTIVKPIAELLLHYTDYDRSLDENDAALTIVQWAAESADPQVYDRGIVREPKAGELPRDVFMVQGIVDHYIMPPIADTTSLSLGLDFAGPIAEAMAAELAAFTPLSQLLTFSGRGYISLPAKQNVPVVSGAGKSTAVVVQYPADAVEDGHEVIFQTDAPKYQYKCFLQSFAAGATSVPPGLGATPDTACP